MNHSLLGELSLALNNLNLQELKKYSKDNKVSGYSKYSNKKDLINYITSKQKADGVEKQILISSKQGDINVLDLFSGCGGLTNGFDKFFNVICGIDVWDVAIESYNSNYDHLGLCRDLTNFKPDECKTELEKAGFYDNIDIIIGGPSCQAYSLAGRRDVDDKRSNLFIYYYEYVKYFKPKVIVMENVIGLLSVKDKDGNLVLDSIMDLLSKDYNCCINKLYARDFEVPQIRRRVIIIGFRKDLNIIPEEIKPISENNHIPVSAILERREDVDIKYFLSTKAINGILKKKERMKSEGKGFGAQFLDLDKPSYTIPARYWKDGYDALVKYSDMEIRRLTVLELKRIQTFPDDYILCGSKKDMIMQIGNAVACRFSYHIAEYIFNILQS